MNTQEIIKTEKAKISESSFAACVVAFVLAFIKITVTVVRVFWGFDKNEPAEIIGKNVSYIFKSVVVTAAIIVLALMFKGISKSGTPFKKESVRSIRAVAVLLFVNSLVGPLSQTITIDVLNSDFKYPFALNETYILFGIICMFIAQLFSYGCALQEDHDETI